MSKSVKTELIRNPLLLIIDMQNVYAQGQKWECKGFNRALDRINEVLAQGDCKNVILTRYIANKEPKGIWADYNEENADVNLDMWANELVDGLKKWCDKYNCYDKSVYSSYSIEEVRNAAEKASSVIVTGVVAECCVLSTVMSLIDAGVYVIYLKDAIAGVDEDTEDATLKVLEGLAPLHLSIMTTKEYLKNLDLD